MIKELSVFPLGGKVEGKVKGMAVYFAICCLVSSPVFTFFCLEAVPVNWMWERERPGRLMCSVPGDFQEVVWVYWVNDEHFHFLVVGKKALLSFRSLMSDFWLKHTKGKIKDSTAYFEVI